MENLEVGNNETNEKSHLISKTEKFNTDNEDKTEKTEEKEPKRRGGRPRGSKNRETLLRARARRSPMSTTGPGGIKAPPEFKHRVAATSLKDTYAAANRAHQHELEFWTWKCGMINAHNRENGLNVALPEKPKHPFETAPAEPTFGKEECIQFLTVMTIIPAQLGFETRPTKEATEKAGDALAKLLRHYPHMDTVMTDWLMVGLAGFQWSVPWLVEYRAKKDGTWVIKRGEYQRIGLVPPDDGSVYQEKEANFVTSS